MLIIPALYLQNGKCVSLYKGRENDQKRVYRRSPKNIAIEFERQGAALLHIIDLNGSPDGVPTHLPLITQICETLSIPVQVGGGIHELQTIETLFNAGVARVIVGVSARPLIPEALKRWGPQRILFGIKARQNWVESHSLAPESDEVGEIAEQIIQEGITQIVYTDMERQGTLFHPNYDEIERMIYFLPDHVKIFSAGGVKSNQDLTILRGIGTRGAILTRALMEHKMSLQEAIRAHQSSQDLP